MATQQAFTEDEMAQIREYRRQANRRFWHKMSMEERRETRQRYDLNAARKQQERDRAQQAEPKRTKAQHRIIKH